MFEYYSVATGATYTYVDCYESANAYDAAYYADVAADADDGFYFGN